MIKPYHLAMLLLSCLLSACSTAADRPNAMLPEPQEGAQESGHKPGVSTSNVRYSEANRVMPSISEAEKALSQINNEDTRLQAIAVLAQFAAGRIYQVGSVWLVYPDPHHQAVVEQATEALQAQRNFPTIKAAIESENPLLQFWGLWNIRPSLINTDDDWETLLPRLRELAKGDDSFIRGATQQSLKSFPDQRQFLVEWVDSETNLGNIMRLIYGSNFNQRMNPHVLRLIRSPNTEDRRHAIGFIGSNSNRASMWQLEYSEDIYREVFDLSSSDDARIRAATVRALGELRNYDLEATRERLIEMADDQSSDVRWTVALILKHEKDLPSVNAALRELLHDEVPLVQYFAVLSLGPENHIEVLRQLAASDDAQVAEWAARRLP